MPPLAERRPAEMYESDKVVGSHYADAVRWIEARDLWDEVVDLVADAYGTVVRVLH